MSKIQRKTAMPMSEILKVFLIENHLTTALNTRRIFCAWDEVSGAGAYTVRRFFRDGKLYITLNSSVVRSQLQFQKDLLIEKLNAALDRDELFTENDRNVGHITQLILK